MARPRFAPTGRRATSPGSAPPSFTPPSPVPPGGTPPSFSPRGRPGVGLGPSAVPPVFTPRPQSTSRDPGFLGIPGLIDDLTSEPGRIYRRPLTVLGAVFRVLGVGENIAVGFGRSVAESGKKFEKMIGGEISPWAYIAGGATQGGAFTEIKEAVAKNRTYEEWLRESQDPNSFLYKNAFVVGLGLSIFGDPLTYVSFGATAASKNAGQKLLAASYFSSADEATEAVLTGVIRRTGEDAAEYGYNFDRILHRIHTASQRPYTMGDALGAIRRADRGELPDISEDWLRAMGVKPRGPVRGTLRRTFARGGQGIRFAGAEIPGTRGLGGRIGEQVRRIPGLPDRDDTLDLFKFVIPDSKLRKLSEDATRAIAMAEFTRANSVMALARTGAFDEALELFAVDPIKAQKLKSAPYLGRAAAAIRNIFDEVPPAVPKRARLNLLKPGFKPRGKWVNYLNKIRDEAYKTRDNLLKEAEDMGFSETQIDSMRRMWDEHVDAFDDPVDVLARWQASVAGTMAGWNVVDQIMRNPLLARPLISGADDLARLEDEMATLNERIARATKRWQEKGISNRQKSARFAVLQDLQRKSEELTGSWSATKKRMAEEVGEAAPYIEERILPTIAKEGEPRVVFRQSRDWQSGRGWKAIMSEDELLIPSDDAIEANPWKQYFRVLVEADSPHRVYVGSPGGTHDELFDQAAEDGLDIERMIQGTGVFQEDSIARINIWSPDEGIYAVPDDILAKAATEPKTILEEFGDNATTIGGKFGETLQSAALRAARAAFSPLPTKKPKVGAVFDEAAARAAFHEDAVPYTWRGEKYLVPAPIAQPLDEIRNPQLVDKEIRKWFRAMNFTQNKWKILATSVNPRFHVMNFVGGMWNNMLGGVYNPNDYVQQWTSMFRQRLARMDEDTIAGRMFGPLRGRVDPDKLARDRAQLDAYEARHVGGGFVSHEVHPEIIEMKRKTDVASGAGRAFRAARQTYAGGTISLSLAPDEWVPDEIEESPLFNPLAGVLLGLPELARAGRYLASDVETVLRETPMRTAARDPSYWQMMEAYSITPPVNFGRWMGETEVGATHAARELIWDIGAANAIRYQFDYSNLTNFERYFAKTLFPFYTWNKNNFVLQVQELANRPRFLAVVGDVANYMNYITSTEENEHFSAILPEYFDKLGMFRVPVPAFLRETMGLPQDQDLYLNPTLPFASLNLFPPLWEVANDDSLTPNQHRWLQIFSPLFSSIGPNAVLPMFKPMVEYSIGYNLGLARPLDYQALQSLGWRHSYREAPGFFRFVPKQLQGMWGIYKDPQSGQLMMDASLAYVAEQMASPFISSSGDVFNWGQGGANADRIKANNFAYITGVRLTPVDPLRLQRSFLYRVENFLEGQRGDAKRRGEEFSREDLRMLVRVRAALKVIEAEWDRRQRELFEK